jgi:ABC-2 type transport system permease protein
LPVTMLALIPMFVSIFSDFGSLPGWLQAIIFAIPFSHPMFAINNMLLGQYWVVLAGIVYMTIFAIGAMMVAVTLFKRDILLTGRVSSAEKKKGIMKLLQMLKK